MVSTKAFSLLLTLFTSIRSAPLSTAHQPGGEDYIVILAADAPHSEHVLSRIGLWPGHADIHHIYNNSAFRGFAGNLQRHCIDALSSMYDVQHVERAQAVAAHTAPFNRKDATWGLQRISTSSDVGGNPMDLDYTYAYADSVLGAGVDIYVVDTGINTANIAFGGRARMGFSYETDASDQNGHGTHVSGTAASNIFGVASGANLIGVKVLGSSGAGTTTWALAGMDYVVQQHDANKSGAGFVGTVMSMSWGLQSTSPVVDTAVSNAVAHGVHVSVAAGNSGDDACNYSPSSSGGTSSAGAVSVGSIGISAAISSFSNTGPCVDVYAPGENVLSTWIGADNTINYLTGTSMACPHVTGLMAYLMTQNATLASSPAKLKQKIAEMALRGIVTGNPLSGDSKLLLNNGITGGNSGAQIPNLFGSGR